MASSDTSAVTVSPSSLSFTSGSNGTWKTAQTVTITVASNSTQEGATASINLTGSSIISRSVSVTVYERIEAERNSNNIHISEGSTETFTYRLTSQPPANRTIQVRTSHADLRVSSGGSAPDRNLTLTFTPGNWSTLQTVTLSMAQDADRDDITGQEVNFTLGNGLVHKSGSSYRITVLMLDDDIDLVVPSAPVSVGEGSSSTFNVKLSHQPDSNRRVRLRRNNSNVSISPTTLNFTSGNWNTNQAVMVSTAQDADTATESTTITLSGKGFRSGTVTATAADDDSVALTVSSTSLSLGEGSTGTFTVRLATDPGESMTVNLASDNSDVTLSASSLTFTGGSAGNWDDTQTVTVTAAQDGDDDDDTADISLSGTRITGETVEVSVSDSVEWSIIISDTTWQMNEGERFNSTNPNNTTFRLSHQPTGNVAVEFTSSSDKVEMGYQDLGFGMSFTQDSWDTAAPIPWSPSSTTAMQAYSDNDTDDHIVTLNVTATGGGYDGISTTIELTILDDDIAARPVLPSAPVQVEEGDSATFNVKLASNPGAGGLAVALTAPAGSNVTVSPTTLNFTGGGSGSGNWNTNQAVTVSAADNSFTSDETTVEIGVSPRATASAGVTVKVLDRQALTLSSSSLSVEEGDSGTFTVKLAQQPGSSRTVSLASNNTDVTLSPATLTFTTGNWNAAQTVTVSAGDDDDTANESATISLSGAQIKDASLTVNVTDDDIGFDLSATSLTVAEGDDEGFTVKLKVQPTSDVTVTPAQPSNSANADVTLAPASLTFTTLNWNTPQTVTVSAADDDDAVADTATINLTASGGGYGSATGSVSVSVTEDDAVGLTISESSLDVDEDDDATFTVALASEPSADVTVTLTSDNADVTIADTDTAMTGNQNTLTFTASNWDDAQTVTVNAANDDDAADDSATISLTAAGGDYGSVTGSLTVDVDDDDEVALTISATSLDVTEGSSNTFTVRLDSVPSGNVTVTLTQPSNTDVTADTDTGAANNQNTLTFTTANWDDTQTVTVSAAHDNDTDDETASISISASGGGYGSADSKTVTVNVTDDDVEAKRSSNNIHIAEGSTETFTYVLESQPLGNRTIGISTTHADLKVSSGGSTPSQSLTLTFTPSNWSTEQTVTLSMEQDADRDDITGQEVNFTLGDGLLHKSGSSYRITVLMLDEDIDLVVPSAAVSVGEGSSATFNVKLSHQPDSNRTVRLSLNNSDVSISPTSLTFTSSDWSTDQSVTVSAAQDADTADESATITLGGKGFRSGTVTATATDDDSVALTLSPTSLSVDEGSTGSFTVKLATDPGESMTVSLASNNTDVTLSGSSLTFTGGSAGNWGTAQSVTVTAAEDNNDFDDETATINLTGTRITAADLTVNVTDNDIGFDLSAMSLTVAEGGDETFTVKLRTQPTATVTVTLAQPSNTANADVTFTPTSLDFTTTDWNANQTVTVSAADDDDAVADTATINLTAAGGGYGSVTDSVSVSVTEGDTAGFDISESSLDVDEDDDATFTVRLTSEPSANVTLTLASNNTDVTVDKTSLNFTASNWDDTQTVTVSAADDDDAADDSATISLTAAGGDYGSVTGSVMVDVSDDDEVALILSPTMLSVTENSSNTFTIRLASVPSTNVTVTLTQPSNTDVTVDTDTTVTGNQTTMSFAASGSTNSWNTAREVTVSAADDTDSDNDTATIDITVAGGGYGSVTGRVTVSVTDDDIGFDLSAMSLTVAEGGDETFTVKLKTRPTGDVTVTLAQPSNSTNDDVTFSSTPLTFTDSNWEDAQTVTVSAADDDDAVTDTATINLSASGGGYGSVTGSVSVSVTDDEMAGLEISESSLDVDEDDDATFTVKLTSEPSDDVTVTLASNNTDVTIADTNTVMTGTQNTLTFTASNWDDTQTVTVNAADDDDAADDSATISLTATGGDYGSVAGSVTVNVDDDDEVALTVSTAMLSVTENATNTFTVKLDSVPSGNVTVTLMQPTNTDVTVDTDTNTANNQNTLTFTTADWDDTQTVTVSAADDSDSDNEDATINISASGGGYDSADSKTVMVDVTDDDIGFDLSAMSLTVAEGDDETFTVKLRTRPTATVMVTLAQPSNSTNADVTFDKTSLTFTATDWNTNQTVMVSAAQDDDAVTDTATINLTASGGDYGSVTGSVSVSVTDDEMAGLEISESSLDVDEDDDATFTVKLTSEPSANVTVTLAQPSNTANADVTFTPTPLTFTASNWDDTQTVTVSAANDDDAADDSATISLTAAGGDYGSVTGSLTVNVDDDDEVKLILSTPTLSVTENATNTFTVRLDSVPSGDVTVTLMQPSNTEVTLDTDTSTANNQNTLTFTTADWDDDQTVTVSAADDNDSDNEDATINISASGGGYGSVTGKVTVNVTDDDIGFDLSAMSLTVAEGDDETFTVKLRTRPTATVTVTLAQPSNSANADVTLDKTSLTFTATDWNTNQTVMVSAADDDDAVTDTATINLTASGGDYGSVTGSLSVSVTDDDTAGLTISGSSLDVDEDDDATFTVRLATEPSDDVTLTLTSNNTDVTVDTDTGAANNQNTLTFTASNWDDAQTVTVNAANDDDAADETANISLTAAGGDYGSITGSLTVNVDDDDEAALTLSVNTLSVDEGGDGSFTVRLATLPSAGVTVSLVQGGTANTDVSFTPASLDFTTANWDDTQTVTVSAAQDADVDQDRATISLSAAGGGYGSATGSVSITVIDDDSPQLILTPNDLTVAEGESISFAVRLNARPAGDATIALASDNVDVTLSPSSLTFTTSNWETAQTVRVETVRDSDSTDDTAAVSLTGTGVGDATLSVTVTDNGDIGLELSATSLTLDEGGEGSFTVKLGAEPAGTATIALESNNDDVTLSDDTLSFTGGSNGNWNTPRSVTVSAADDDDSIDDGAIISLRGDGITTGTVSVTVTDDDKGVTIEEEEGAAVLILAEVAGALLPAAGDAISLRFDAGRSARTATVAGRQIALDRSAARDLAAGFAERAGVRDTSQGRYAEDRFGAERHSGDWLGGIALDAGRPLRSGHERSSGMSGQSALLSGFSYALNADAKGGGSGWSVWGRLDTGEFSGTSDGVEFDSSQSNFWLGADRRFDNGVLSGVAYSSSGADADYTLGKFGAAIETDLTLVMPYAETEFGSGATGHAMLGIGSGTATITQTDQMKGSADLSVYMLAAGGSWPSAWDIGLGELSWSGDFGYTSMSTSGSELPSLNGLSVSSMQLKGGMELAFADLGEAWRASPRAALLMRLDAGDGVTGTGFELTGGMQMASASSDRFSLDVNLRTLILHSAEELTDWGMSIQFRFSPRSDGGGLEFAAGPHWGAPEDGGLLDRDEAFRLDEADRQSRQVRGQDRGLAANLGYGLRAFGGMLTPYSEYRFTSGSSGSIRQVAGVRFNGRDTLELSLFSERHIAHRGEVQSRLAVELQKRF